MVNKGKYQLLTYIVDRYLLFYKSLNRKQKIIAFAMFEAETTNQIIPILNEFLKKRFIQYYSIQLNVLLDTKPLFLLSFEEINKENIIRLFNLIHQKLIEEKLPIKIRVNSILEHNFLDIIMKGIEPQTNLIELNESILVKSNNISYRLDFFSLNIDRIDCQHSFIHNFLSIINKFNRKGYLIIYFICNNDEDIKFSLYFTDYIVNVKDNLDLENSINNLFNYNIIKKRKVKIKEFYSFLWRRGITDNFYFLKHYSDLFRTDQSNNLDDLLTFNQDFEKSLLKNNIKFMRFSDNLLFVDQSFLFLSMLKIKPKFIKKIIQRYLSKYFIFILILNEKDASKLLEVKRYTTLKNLQVLRLEEMSKFNFNIFKRELEDT
ncbi:MAG: hypothetical protein ACFFD7_03575 [Candidatus Thorarchaeota archaeon]